MRTTYDARKISSRRYSAAKFLREAERSPSKTANARFIPPRLGSKNYGHFEVKLDNPVYEVEVERS